MPLKKTDKLFTITIVLIHINKLCIRLKHFVFVIYLMNYSINFCFVFLILINLKLGRSITLVY